MKNLPRNTAAVLVLTLFTGLAVFTAVQLGDRLFGTADASAQPSATQSESGYGQSDGSGDAGEYGYGGNGYGQTDPYGYGGSSGSQGSTGGTQTCPATGCSASSCHATQ